MRVNRVPVSGVIPWRLSTRAEEGMTLSATLPIAVFRWDADPPSTREEQSLDQAETLDRFLLGVEKRAYRIARIAVRHDDDALDIVQDAMLQLTRRYAQRPSKEWRPLFYRILQNRIRDCQRRRKVRGRVMAWLPGWKSADEEAGDPYEAVPDGAPQPVELLKTDQALIVLEQALAELPGRQQEAFMLRNCEGRA